MKKILFSFFLFLTSLNITSTVGAEVTKAYANFYSLIPQNLAIDANVAFEEENKVKYIGLSDDFTEIQIKFAGTYLITFTATGGQGTATIPLAGVWNLGLFLNDVQIPGGVFGIDAPTSDSLSFSGQILIEAEKNDILQLRNTSSLAIYIHPINVGRNSSASIIIDKIE